MIKKLRPIIKWTGGKYNEFAFFSEHIPKFDRYIEPFFGGGGVFFALQPSVQAYINDKSTDLINFYQQINTETFKTELYKYANAWDELLVIHHKLWANCAYQYVQYIANEITFDNLSNILSDELSKTLKSSFLFNEIEFIVDQQLFEKILLASMLDKARRIKRIFEKENRQFNESEIKLHFETGIRSGAYLFFRKILNQQYAQSINLSASKAAANWYFVREFCYASMFRFNAKGEFNIPYGGIAYNKKNFRQKVDHIFDKLVIRLFENAEIFNLDFEDFLNKIKLTDKDFIFLDPPYDSEFSEYDQSAFTKDDQQRLASYLIKT